MLNEVFSAATASGEFDGFRTHTTEQAATPGAAVAMLPFVTRPRQPAASSAAPTAWRDSLTTPRHEPETVLREREAAWVAAAIHELVHRDGVAPADIMVLCRKRESLRLVAPALQRLHLPFAAVEELALNASPEARDLIALLDLLASPRHRLSLLQVLRCPLFGASDADLVELASRAAGDRRRLVAGAVPRIVERARAAQRGRVAAALAGRRAASAAARSARPHRPRGRAARACRRDGGARTPRRGARRDRCGARPGAASRRRALCDAVQLRARAAAACDQRRAAEPVRCRAAADDPRREGAGSARRVRDGRRPAARTIPTRRPCWSIGRSTRQRRGAARSSMPNRAARRRCKACSTPSARRASARS